MANIRSPDFIPPSVLLSAPDSDELRKLIHRLKDLLVVVLEDRQKVLRGRLRRKSHVVRRKKKNVEAAALVCRIDNRLDAIMNTSVLKRKCFLESFMVTQSAPRVVRERAVSLGNNPLLHRLSLKIDKPISLQNEESLIKTVNLQELRERVISVRIREKALLEKSGYSPKLLLTEYAKRVVNIPKTTESRANEIVALIDIVDNRLSTSEALTVLKQLGIDYQPRSALGKKNLMATGLSSLLASNGLKLMAEPTTHVQHIQG